MLYQKPNKPFVEICKEFDNEFYTKTRDDNKLYRYMWNIYYMLACKARFFARFEDYDDYASFAANTIYMRYIRKEKQGERYKSILNYAKNTYYHLKVMFQNETYNQVLSSDDRKTFDATLFEDSIKDSINSEYRTNVDDGLIDVFETIPQITWKVVKNTPYKYDVIMCKRLYMSCLLSYLNSITLSNVHKQRLQIRGQNVSEEFIDKIYTKEKENSTILWRLDEQYTDFVSILVTRIKKIIAKTFMDVNIAYNLQDDVLDDIMKSAWNKSSQEGSWNGEDYE